MNLEAYLETVRQLGVQRGQLEEGFRPDLWLKFEREPEVIDAAAAPGAEPPPIQEDLSRFAIVRRPMTDEQRMRVALARCKPATRPIYESLAARSMTVARLAEITGIERVVIVHAISGSHISQRTFDLCWPLFTAHEQAMLRWPEILRRKGKVQLTERKRGAYGR